MNDKEDMYYLMEFRQTHLDLWDGFLKEKGELAEWKEYIKREFD